MYQIKLFLFSLILICSNITLSQVSKDSLYYKISRVENDSVLPIFEWKQNGITYSSKDYLGRVILLNFWAEWCQPCVDEMKDLSEISLELNDRGLELFGIRVFPKTKSPDLNEFLAENPVSYSILDGNSEIIFAFSQSYGEEIDVIPTSFIIDKKGKIVERIVGQRKKEVYRNLILKYL